MDWSVVHREHIIEACRQYDAGIAYPSHPSKNTFLVFRGNRYPAKFIRGLAYKVATGDDLNPKTDFSGGMETARFFIGRGFDIEYRGKLMPSNQPVEPAIPKNLQQVAHFRVRRRSDAESQRNALRDVLQELFGYVQTEVSFDWLIVPQRSDMDHTLSNITEALASMRGHREFFTPGERLRCDFFVPSQKLVIEYDERQHFTLARAEALSHYPPNLPIRFNKDAWLSACRAIRANDPSPPYRDEQRAFYDSLRDILATRNGIVVLRIRHGSYDWTDPAAKAELQRVCSQPTRVVTVCLEDEPASELGINHRRQVLVTKAVDIISDRGWHGIGAVLFPGGFFCFNKYVGSLEFDKRVAVLESTAFHRLCVDECGKLVKNSPGALIVAGVDGIEQPRELYDKWGDQLCVAWSAQGIVGIGRKVFPAKPPQNEKYDEKLDESLHYVCYVRDYSDEKRVVSLPNGRKAILCACYDMFGCAETVDTVTARTKNIINLHDGSSLRREHLLPPFSTSKRTFGHLRRTCIGRFHRLLVENDVSIGLVVIHRFGRPGLEGYWQRHGIQTCSAALKGGLAVGAAHFREGLPSIRKSTLAAAGIPERYLSDKPFQKRRKSVLMPTDGVSKDGLLVRLFEFQAHGLG